MKPSTFAFTYQARRAQPGQALGHDHCLHRLPQRLHDVEHFATLVRSQRGQHGQLLGPAERDGGLCGPQCGRRHHPVGGGEDRRHPGCEPDAVYVQRGRPQPVPGGIWRITPSCWMSLRRTIRSRPTTASRWAT